MNPLRVGIVGVGFGQRVHLPAFQSLPGCVVEAVCASTEVKARMIADRHQIPGAYGDWKQLIADPRIDVISIAVPPVLQPEIAMTALRAGKPVFCEKPISLTSRESGLLREAALQSGRAAMVNYTFMDIDVWSQAQQVVRSGALGRLRHVQVSWHVETRAEQLRLQSWKRDPLQGGGVLNAFVCHVLHYLEHLIGPVSGLSARLQNACASLHLDCAGGIPVSVTVSTDAFQGSGHRIEIYGDFGSLLLMNETRDYMGGFHLSVHRRQDDAVLTSTAATVPDPVDGRIPPTRRLLSRFVNWIQRGEAAHPDFSDAHRIQTLLELVQVSSERHRWCFIQDGDVNR